MTEWRPPMPQISADIGIGGGGLSLAAIMGAVNGILQAAVLLLTIVAILYRIRGERARTQISAIKDDGDE